MHRERDGARAYPPCLGTSIRRRLVLPNPVRRQRIAVFARGRRLSGRRCHTTAARSSTIVRDDVPAAGITIKACDRLESGRTPFTMVSTTSILL